MHPFPRASELQFLLGKDLELISLGYWQIQFFFGECHIAVQGDLEHVDSEGRFRRHNSDETRLAPLCLHHLLGQAVREVTAEAYCLTLRFERGDLLRIFSDDGPYECGQIYPSSDPDTLIVF